jgi:MoxR-like ATPase
VPQPAQASTTKSYFHGDHESHPLDDLPDPPPWRRNGDEEGRKDRGLKFRIPREKGQTIIAMVNAALVLRRPLLVTGKPGTGKSSLAHAVAEELDLGEVLVWPINTRTTLQNGLYHYDAIGRLNDVSIRKQRRELAMLREARHQTGPIPADPPAPPGPKTEAKPVDRPRRKPGLGIGNFIRLGPLGTALAGTGKPMPAPEGKPPTRRPRVLLIDEIDKGDIDLPNDLLHVFEQGEFEIPELSRLPDRYQTVSVRSHDRGSEPVPVKRGRVICEQFPLVIMTSNGEREFPPAFRRRCLPLEMTQPGRRELEEIVGTWLAVDATRSDVGEQITTFLERRDGSPKDPRMQNLAIDQLLNAVYLILKGVDVAPIGEALFKPLDLSV